MQVKKRDGRLEVFMPEKIVVSAVKCDCPYETARDIASAIESRAEDPIDSATIREYIFSELKSRDVTSSIEKWERYEKTKSS